MKFSSAYWTLVVVALTFYSCKEKTEANEIPINIQFEKEAELTFINRIGDTVATLNIELAEDDYEHQTGLMHRKEMNDDQGMLFVFNDEIIRSTFYMKNTYIPLDMVYLDKDLMIVDVNKNTTPLDENPIPSRSPSMYVLELTAGSFEKLGLQAGDEGTLIRQ
ncbi:hypothetical protein GCM10009117_26080 [Gangjinia marincola]|uniref:DUF192 domain-containing protein n=1 Tax=Gangjinia marincola TaxID=578463 RepID=A0ABP3XVX3_9FLAO